MSGCCEPSGYEGMFTARFARHLGKRYRRRGLDRTATKMVAFLAEHGIEGATVLEIGGGVGDVQIELLRRGAARTTNLELVDAYDDDAAALAREAGFTDRMTRRRVDLALDPDAVEPHDVVVLHRVVCCYPDDERLLSAAASRANRLLVFSHPRANRLNRVATAAENLWFRVRRTPFRTFLHDPDAMVRAASSGGLSVVHREIGRIWSVVGLATSSGPGLEPSPSSDR